MAIRIWCQKQCVIVVNNKTKVKLESRSDFFCTMCTVRTLHCAFKTTMMEVGK